MTEFLKVSLKIGNFQKLSQLTT